MNNGPKDTTRASFDGDGTLNPDWSAERVGGETRKKDGKPIPNISSASPSKEFLSQATDCPLKSLVYHVRPSSGKEVAFYFGNSGHFKVFYFLHKVTVTGF